MIKVEKKHVGRGFFQWYFCLWCPDKKVPLIAVSFISKSPLYGRDWAMSELKEFEEYFKASKGYRKLF